MKNSQPLDYVTPSQAVRPRRFLTILFVTCLAVALFAVLFVDVPSTNLSKATANRAKCATNMHAIGLAIQQYNAAHSGAYPSRLDDLLEQQISPSIFVCPESNDEPSTNTTAKSIAADFHTGHHISYIYIGKGLTDKTATANIVVLYEPLIDHAEGINVLFGDGHVEFADSSVAKKIIAVGQLGKRVFVNNNLVTVGK